MTGNLDSLQPGIEARIERTIDSTMLTAHVAGGGLFSTPSMILLMELAAHGAVEGYLSADQTTVGYEVCVRHVAPAKAGEQVVVIARLKEVNGTRLLFDVNCSKREDDTLLGSGTHKRAIIVAPQID